MTKHAIQWTKEQRQIAVKEGKALLAVGIDGNGTDDTTGRYAHFGPCLIKNARVIFFLSFYLNEVKTELTEKKLREVFEKQVTEFKKTGLLK